MSSQTSLHFCVFSNLLWEIHSQILPDSYWAAAVRDRPPKAFPLQSKTDQDASGYFQISSFIHLWSGVNFSQRLGLYRGREDNRGCRNMRAHFTHMLIFLTGPQWLFPGPLFFSFWFSLWNGAASWLREAIFCLPGKNSLRSDAISRLVSECVFSEHHNGVFRRFAQNVM